MRVLSLCRYLLEWQGYRRSQFWGLLVVLLFAQQGWSASDNDPMLLFEPRALTFLLPNTESGPPGIPFNNIAYNARDNVLTIRYTYSDTVLYHMNLNTGEIAVRTISGLLSGKENLKEETFYLYHPDADEMLFYDVGIGRVFRLGPEGPAERIDNSFNHQNQHGHAPWIDEKGQIYAFGGYGLFTFKSHVTKFNRQSNEWDMLFVADESQMPAPQVSAFAYPDIIRNQVYIVAADMLSSEMPRYHHGPKIDRQAIWRLEYDKMRWTRLGAFDNFKVLWQLQNRSVHPDGTFLLLTVADNSKSYIVAYFTATHRYVSLSDLGVSLLRAEGVEIIFWSPRDEAFYLVETEFMWGSRTFKVMLSRLRFPDPESFVARYGSPLQSSYTTEVVLVMLLMLGGTGLVVLRRRRKRLRKSTDGASADLRGTGLEAGIATESTRDDFAAGIHTVPQIIRIEGPDEYGHFKIRSIADREREVETGYEGKLLELLVRHFKTNPNRYTSADEIDAILIPNHPSVDYIRRVRNMSVNNLEEILKEVSGLSDDEILVLRRSVITDKRKFEYRLNDAFIQLSE